MGVIKLALIMGVITRPIEIVALLFLAYKQMKTLKRRSRLQTMKYLILAMFVINLIVFSVALVVDVIGIWYVPLAGPWVGFTYVINNVVSGLLLTGILIAMYNFKVRDHA